MDILSQIFNNNIIINSAKTNFLTDTLQSQNKVIFVYISSGIITSLSIFGPAIAYGLGGVFSQIYVTLEGRRLQRCCFSYIPFYKSSKPNGSLSQISQKKCVIPNRYVL